ncbi:alpha-1-antitrypsin homolog [Antennarius striatus]|uniref:alpha-1-antitrypsin homolog n=1 Tax=Antennarius striatus TaxID=241820 RepID=UPI0035AF3365
MRGIIASCTLAALLLAVAWADHHGKHDNDHQHHQHNTEHHQSGDDHSHNHGEEMSCHMLAPHNADFAFALYRSLTARTVAGENIFFSPLGIASALSMLSTGAKGETHQQLFSTLRYGNNSQEDINKAYQHLFHMFHQSDENPEFFLGNAAAVRTGFSPLQKFVTDVENSYSGKLLNVDFSNPEEAAGEINQFIATKTHNMIKDQVKALDPDMVMVLINYITFNGEWKKHFDNKRTKKENFQVDTTTTVEVDMMERMGRYEFYHDAENHTKVIMLPYKSNTSMMIVLPDEGKMEEVEGYIDRAHIIHWHDSLYTNSVELSMPKFHISAKAPLDISLKEMGITDAFGNNADFSGISEEVKLKVSKVSHQAVLSVFEAGTKAAAVTTVEVMPMSMPETMKINRPFLTFILEDTTRSILFMGKISNPKPM